MTVYIDLEGERAACEFLALEEDGARLRGADWELTGYTGALYGEDGAEISLEAARLALLRERAVEIWGQLREAGMLDELFSHSRLLDRLLDALATVPLLKNIIAKLREKE